MADLSITSSMSENDETHSPNKENNNLEESSGQNQLGSKETEVEIDSVEAEKGSGLLRLPIARIKKIMKADPSLGIASQDSVFLIAKATELFIESLVVESYQNMTASKKKTISKRDFDSCVESIDSLAFLDGAIYE
ncbi:DNA polymerase epsilon subunit 4 [Armadillidium vulgare]|nr:DNA polymerase epsilon subunit 4 [Armadillidium vulgare]